MTMDILTKLNQVGVLNIRYPSKTWREENELKKSQTFVQLDVRNWDNTELVESLYEICETSKAYENDVVEVHQVVDLGKLKNEWR
ncbi:hypothetical protein ACFVSS_24920 [Peribacillus butanolivorans]|uniref:hypothetical protein n=1 Tax=Peribacillus butanolivorans TaxID=421767 RepID=UPI003672FAA7